MSEQLNLGSLFSGSGGFELAGSIFGINPIWSSEIEPFPIRVTEKNFPETIQLGDITKIRGWAIPKVHIITGGSPCQDMSIAGRREGLDGDRSSLFREQIRIVKEMRDDDKLSGRTGKDVRCRWMVWENVPGAFTSNERRDFQAVLTEIVRIAEPEAPDVPMPDKGGGQSQDASWEWKEAGQSHTDFSMLNTGAFPKDAVESTLSQILEAQAHPKYYLSEKACLGILRRAEKRGKELPDILKQTLIRQSWGVTLIRSESGQIAILQRR